MILPKNFLIKKSKNHCQTPGNRCMPMFLLCAIFLALAFGSMIHFYLIFEHDVRYESNFIFACRYSVVPVSFIGKTILSPI